MSTNHARIPAILLAGDGGPGEGGDDVVNVTTQIANNFSLLADLSGVVRFTTLAGKPVSNNFAGKIAQEIDTGNLFIHDGAQWQILPGSIFTCTAATRPSAGTYTLYEKLQIFETDTKAIGYYLEGTWRIWDTVWQSYTPAWTASGTQPSIGNGTLTGKYLRRGREVAVHAVVSPGSTTTFGSGQYYISMPAGLNIVPPHGGVLVLGTGFVMNSGNWYMIGTPNFQSATTVSMFLPVSTASSGQGQWGATAPWVFKNGDQADFAFMAPI